MPRYLITHPHGQQADDILIEDPALTLTFHSDWAVFSDHAGPSLALPAGRGATIQRIDQPPDGQATSEGPAPER